MNIRILGLCSLIAFSGSIWVGYWIFSTAVSHYGSVYDAGLILTFVLPITVPAILMCLFGNGLSWLNNKLMSPAEREVHNECVEKLRAQEREQAAIRYAKMAKKRSRSSSYEPPSGLDVSDGGGG